VVACVSENESVCRGRERGALYRQSDGWSQQFLKKTRRLVSTRVRSTARLHRYVYSVLPSSLTLEKYLTQFSLRVLILASAIYSVLPSSGWLTESQQMGLSYLIESFHAQKNSKK
jgi:hypothetical protein